MPSNGTPISLLGYHFTFDAEMSSPADMAKFSTVFSNGDHTLWTNQEAEWYGDYSATNPNNPFSFANGALNITASPVNSGAALPYTSGLIQTANTFSQNRGYFEIRAQVPTTPGFWSAFWQLPTGGYYPEVDILEQPNTSGTKTQYWTHTDSPTDKSSGYNETGVDLSTGFHTYGFMWTGTFIQYVFDGKYIGSPHDTPALLAASQMYLLANLAVGGPGSWPGVPAAGAKATLQIDYIRAYSSDPTVAAVVAQPISSPDGANTTPVLLAPAWASPTVIGTGPDSLTLKLAETVLPGAHAQFTVAVDGVQQGGVSTVQADDAFDQVQTFTVNGTFGAGVHNVSINFLNDAYVGGVGDRNLLVKSAAINGTAINGLPLNLYSSGTQGFSFTGQSPVVSPVVSPPVSSVTPVPTPDVTIGSGVHALVLSISEDAWNGDAHYTVSVDNKQVGGTMAATAAHAAGASQSVTVLGDFAPGAHTASVTFLDDAYGGSADTDRNLYLSGATIDGKAVAGANAALMSSGSSGFSFDVAAPPAPPAAQNTLHVKVSEDAWSGDAQFTVKMDGTLIGGVRTANASHAAGASQDVLLAGNWGSGEHVIEVAFLNDAYGGSSSTDRNLYVEGVSYDGRIAGGPATLLSAGTATFVAPGAPVGALVNVGLSEDAWLEDAQYAISVDGGPAKSGVVTASQALGQSQSVNVAQSLSAGSHDIAVSFLNDAYGGPNMDRNMHVTGITLNGSAVSGATADLWSAGTVHFTVVVPPV